MARFAEKYSDELHEYVNDGKTLQEIADILGVSYATVSLGLKELGLKAKRKNFSGNPDNMNYQNGNEKTQGPIPRISKDQLIKMYVDEDLTVGEIAQRCNVSRQTVYNTMARYGVPRQKKSKIRRMFDLEQVEALMDKNMTTTEAAEKLGVPVSSLRTYIKDNNIKTRNERYAEILTEENLRKWYIDEGRSMVDIANQIGCNYNTVSHACARFGLEKTREQILDTMVNTMKERYGVPYAASNPEIQAKIRFSRSPEFESKIKECKKIAPKMIKEGKTISEIADALGCSYKKTRNMLVDLGLFTPHQHFANGDNKPKEDMM